MSEPERFYLVDGPSYLYRAYHAIGHLSTSRGLPTNATLGMTMMLWKLLKEDRPTYMGIAWDAPGRTVRHQQFEQYKIQRPGMPKDLVEQIPWVRRSFEALALPFLELPGYEADDILATAARRLHGAPIELVLVTARHIKSLAELRAATPESGPTALVFRTGCTYRQRLEQVLTEFGWPSATRFELGTLDGMIGCVAAGMGVTLLPRAVVGRNEGVSIHALSPAQAQVETLFITRRAAHEYSALRGFLSCLFKPGADIAA